ncbi:hypothetical protein EMIHUDRAFT_457718 [Emiliania huxleyi CCMP1516]|uniref:Uncharacterized protein n=2 Tax=Emiliania huxleyi TaxID=2903 RepID=A0A0D3JMN3_EMIH1|nr:hypothetical protein EMIHUDRAFT_457718 [Emiliania huxleyi CCMP1516]EOD24768.1 hypothetical protein EMIHUDRAFT_457718 [Emiliania huxleyi CCMP1516]|eukprot:XP_005777197.1 hypothetical protein EMIHUDRAFT_457718 [Emiliania huxleyi CCMP1516]
MQNRARAAANDRYPSGLMPPDELGKKRGRYVLGEAGSPPTSRALCFAAEVESPASKRARTRSPLSDDPRVERHRYQEMPAPPVPNGFLANVAVEAPTGPAVDNAVFNPHGGTAMLSVEVSVSNGGSDDDVSSLALAASARRGEITLLREAAPQMPPPAAAEPSVANLAKQTGPAEPEALGESRSPLRTPPCVPVRMEPRGSVLIHRDGLPGGVMRGGYDRPPRHGFNGRDRWTFDHREGQPGRGYGGGEEDVVDMAKRKAEVEAKSVEAEAAEETLMPICDTELSETGSEMMGEAEDEAEMSDSTVRYDDEEAEPGFAQNGVAASAAAAIEDSRTVEPSMEPAPPAAGATADAVAFEAIKTQEREAWLNAAKQEAMGQDDLEEGLAALEQEHAQSDLEDGAEREPDDYDFGARPSARKSGARKTKRTD